MAYSVIAISPNRAAAAEKLLQLGDIIALVLVNAVQSTTASSNALFVQYPWSHRRLLSDL